MKLRHAIAGSLMTVYLGMNLLACSKKYNMPPIVFTNPCYGDDGVPCAESCPCNGFDDSGTEIDIITEGGDAVNAGAGSLILASSLVDSNQDNSNTTRAGERLALTATSEEAGNAQITSPERSSTADLLDRLADRFAGTSISRSDSGQNQSKSGIGSNLNSRRSQGQAAVLPASGNENPLRAGGYGGASGGSNNGSNSENRDAIDPGSFDKPKLAGKLLGGNGDGEENQLNFASRSVSGESNIADSEDPEDYFTFTNKWVSIFEIVEKRYRTKSKSWAMQDAQSLR